MSTQPQLLWQNPDWQKQAHDWIRAEAERNSIQLTGEIEQQWRICFRWKAGDCYDVEIADYH